MKNIGMKLVHSGFLYVQRCSTRVVDQGEFVLILVVAGARAEFLPHRASVADELRRLHRNDSDNATE